MKLLNKYLSNKEKQFPTQIINEAPLLNSFPWAGIGSTSSGISVTTRTSLQHSAVYSCVRTLTSDIAKIPLIVEKNINGGWKPDPDHPKNLLINFPNHRNTAFELVESLIFSVLTSGDGFIVVIRDEDGNPTNLVPCRPFSTTVTEDYTDASLYYTTNEPLLRRYKTSILSETGDTRIIYPEDMIRIRNLSFDNGVTGTSILQIAQEAFGLGMATQEAAARSFQNSSHSNGYFKSDLTAGKQTTNRNYEALMRNINGLINSGKTAIIDGLDWIGFNSNIGELQLVESRRESTLEIARMYRMPPYKLGLSDTEKAANIAEQEQSYISNTLVQYTKPFEQHLDRILLSDKERGLFRFRFDFTKQAEPNEQIRGSYYQTAITYGWMSVNEVREREGLPPVPNGDQHLMPLNTGVAGNQNPVSLSPSEDKPNNESGKKDNETSTEDVE